MRRLLVPFASPVTGSRLVFLDVLRFAAIVLVLGRHKESTAWLEQGGWAGVDLFFVLSGFLVSGLLFRDWQQRHEVRARRFLFRRGMKIYPAFYLFLATTVVIATLLGNRINKSGILPEMFFVQNYFPGVWTHTWSLAIEEHFYLGLALLCVLLVRFRIRSTNPFALVPVVFIVVGVTCLALRILTFATTPYSYQTHVYFTHLRVDALTFGVLLCYWATFHRARFEQIIARFWPVILVASALLVAPAFVVPLQSRFMGTVGLSLVYLGFGGLVALASTLRNPAMRPWTVPLGFLAFLGARSYSVYLWHVPVLLWGMHVIRNVGANRGFTLDLRAEFVIYVIVAFSVGVIMAEVVELPMLRIRDRLTISSAPHEVGDVEGAAAPVRLQTAE